MEDDLKYMRRALELAKQGEGFVEPNPMVGCVIVRDGCVVGEGYHRMHGGPHAEIEAIRNAGSQTTGATCYVTLEPCSHYGKTPPCAEAVKDAGFQRIVVAMRDPNPLVAGRGLQLLMGADMVVDEGVLEEEARTLNAPYLMRWEKKRPWIIAKWAMTLDGRLASRTGSSQWISGKESREIVHRLRSRMDAIMVGSGTTLQDDPLLTVRLPSEERSPRIPLRIVLDSAGLTPLESQLVKTAKDFPVLLVVGPEAPPDRLKAFENAGCDILRLPQSTVEEKNDRQRDFRNGGPVRPGFHDRRNSRTPSRSELAYRERLKSLFDDLLQRNVTNLFVEGGSRLFGTLFDMQAIDEVHVFIAPKLIGGDAATAAFGGIGIADMVFPAKLDVPEIRIVRKDVYIHGRVRYPE